MKKYIKIIFIFLSFSLVAQKTKGDKAFKEKDYLKAIKEYTLIAESDKLSNKQMLNLANSYYQIRDYKNASKNYITSINKSGDIGLEQYNQYIQSLKLSGSYTEEVIKEAINLRLDKMSQTIKTRYNAIGIKKPFTKIKITYDFKNLDINSSKSDFGVSIFPDATLMYSSSKENITYNKIYEKIDQPFINIYKTTISKNGVIDTLSTIKYVEESKKHSSSPFYDSLYNRLFFTQSEDEKDKLKFNDFDNNNFRIVYGFVNDDKKLESVNYFPKETNGYSFGHPYFDKETKRLYFVSDMPGGYGGTDIYYVEMNLEGVISEPVNLGENVNSFANEMFPSIVDGKLYFSSDLFIGKGGLDLYFSNIDGKKFSIPNHIEAPVNSNADDFNYLITKSSKNTHEGYISSNREGGKGSDDIYSFVKTKSYKKVQVSGLIKQKGENNITLPGANVTIKDSDGNLINTIVSDNVGMYSVLLPSNKDYMFMVEKEGYISATDKILLANVDNIDAVSKDFYLEKKEIVEDIYGNFKINIEPVYFDFDDASITTKAKEQLQIALDFLNKYPFLNFKLEAHTDARGKKSYNQKLSEKRAKSVFDYLVANGIAAERIISTKGFGETKLINECKDGVTCSEDEHLKNRRTDFVLMEKEK